MSKMISPGNLGKAIERELTIYSEDIIRRIDSLSAAAIKELVNKTKATAPIGRRRGKYKANITSKLLHRSSNGSTYVWYVKAPEYRLTHLLVHGHATSNGGRTKADPFLANAVDEVIPAYERAIEEAVK